MTVTRDFDIVVAGAGPVGLAFALSVGGTGLRVALVDPQDEAALADPGDDGREIALTDRSVAMLDALGAWSRIPDAAVAPLRRMAVLNGPSSYAMQFGGADGIGRFAPNQWLRRSLWAAAAAAGASVLAGRSVVSATVEGGSSVARLSDGQALRTALVVAADTRRSRLRDQQGIGAATHDYGQLMAACAMTHPLPHRETATAWFEYGRCLVTLPLNGGPAGGGRSSAVMTLPRADATRLLALDDERFGAEVTRRYRGRLGAMRPVGGRHAVPVVTAYARRFVGRRFALLGDAAVAMHPTTAHGFNFGLLGQDALARAVRGAVLAGRDPGEADVLGGYERAHRAETRLFFGAAEAVMRLYAAGESWPARLMRDTALRVGNLPPVRAALLAQMRDPDRR